MGSLRPTDDETERINRAYLDVSNFALKNDIEHIWTANHIKRDAEKRTRTKYIDTDIAKCMDIIRHAQAIFGLNRSPEEQEKGILRMELVAQRDGYQFGRALFHADPVLQRMVEFTAPEIKEFEKTFQDSGIEIEPTEMLKKYKGDIG